MSLGSYDNILPIMSAIRDRGEAGYDFNLGIQPVSFRGWIDAIKGSPWGQNLPVALKKGVLGIGGNVTLEGGQIVQVDIGNQSVAPGTSVIVFEKVETYFEK